MDSTKRGLEVITCPAPNPKVKESEGLGMQDIITRPLPANKDYFQQGVVPYIRHIVGDGESTPHNFTLYQPILCQGHFSGTFYQVAFEYLRKERRMRAFTIPFTKFCSISVRKEDDNYVVVHC